VVNSHQVTMLLFDLALILILSQLLGLAARRLGQPAVLGEILAGVLAGPTLFHGAISRNVFPLDTRPLLGALANVGVALFMFLIGLELDRATMRGQGLLLVNVSVGSIAVPFGLGTLLALWLMRSHPAEHPLGFVLFMGAALAVTAFPVLARILTDRGMRRTPIGALALGSAAIGDVLAWSLLAVVVALVGGNGQAQWHILLVVPYALVMVFVVRPALRRLAVAADKPEGVHTSLLAVVLAGLLVSGGLTEWMGLHFVFGAFLLGLLMPREGAERLHAALQARIGTIGGLLLPVYFVVAGMQVDLSHVGLAGLLDLGLILVAAVGGKFAGVYVTARLHRLPPRQSSVLATLMNTRGLTELVILTVGRQLGVIDGYMYSLMVVMAIVTTVMAGPILRILHPPRGAELEAVPMTPATPVAVVTT
jgi:Kef-type K+ transport system membrane component KefB